MTSLLDMNSEEARNFFMKADSYCSIDLPAYFDFSPILAEAEQLLKSVKSSNLQRTNPGKYENLNHRLLSNKDGEYSWRPLEIINPILYVKLVKLITTKGNWKNILERFTTLRQNDKIRCLSIPFERTDDSEKSPKEAIILNWWEEFEQQSVLLSLRYTSITVTDISDCYGSIYTHTISWALHGRESAKQNRSKKLLGNQLDNCLQDMHNRQTNGIPQGSVLSDFLAEIILGYADLLLSDAISEQRIDDYQILRYRDDYRIFTNTQEDGRRILMILTQVLGELNFKLNSGKTVTSDDVITTSIKKDKMAWVQTLHNATSLQEWLLVIREFALMYPNSGSLMAAMSNFRESIEHQEQRPNHNDSLLAILADLMLRNPRIYAIGASTISKLLSFENSKTANDYFSSLKRKFDRVPNTGVIELWLQRVSWKYNPEIQYNETLCDLIQGSKQNSDIWNFDWLNQEIKNQLDSMPVINESELDSMDLVMGLNETELFNNGYYDFYSTDSLDEEETA